MTAGQVTAAPSGHLAGLGVQERWIWFSDLPHTPCPGPWSLRRTRSLLGCAVDASLPHRGVVGLWPVNSGRGHLSPGAKAKQLSNPAPFRTQDVHAECPGGLWRADASTPLLCCPGTFCVSTVGLEGHPQTHITLCRLPVGSSPPGKPLLFPRCTHETSTFNKVHGDCPRSGNVEVCFRRVFCNHLSSD